MNQRFLCDISQQHTFFVDDLPHLENLTGKAKVFTKTFEN